MTKKVNGILWALVGETDLQTWQLVHWTLVSVGGVVRLPPYDLVGDVLDVHSDGLTVRSGGETVRLKFDL